LLGTERDRGEWAPFVWLNGEIVPAVRASVSVFDRGILLGDGVYETVRAHHGRLFRWPSHRDRLWRSLHSARIPRTGSVSDLDRGIDLCLEGNKLGEARLRITITRGSGGPGYRMPEGAEPTVIVAASPWHSLAEDLYRSGVSAVVPSIRQTGRQSLDPGLKSISRIHLVLARMDAEETGAQEALLLGEGGEVREGTASNVFLVSGGTLRTPSLDCGILSGITREAVLQVARAAGIPCREERIPGGDLGSADEIFFTNTSWGALPVTLLDGRPVGDGKPGKVTRDLGERLAALVEEECR
jgi:branched-chain amino acid aminotransferase